MRLRRPSVRTEGDLLVVTAQVDGGGATVHELSITVPRALAGWIDPSATPWIPIATVIAATSGADLDVEGPVSAAAVAGATANGRQMAEWFGWRAPAIDAPGATAADRPAPGRGHAMFFTRGVDSWASLLALTAEPATPPLTHLLSITGVDRERGPDVIAAVQRRTRATAEQLGLPLVEVAADVRDVLDPLDKWDFTHGAVLASVALLLGPHLGRVTIAGTHGPMSRVPWGSHPALDAAWGTERTEIVHHMEDVDRTDKVRQLGGSPLALETLFVCWKGTADRNCGRCAKCLRTMTALDLFGLLERAPVFDGQLSPDAVRRCPEPDSWWMVLDLIDALPPGALRIAWQRHVPTEDTHRRFVGPAVPSIVGEQADTRVNLALVPTHQRTDPADAGPDLVVGWEQGMVPLRPAAGEHRQVAAAVAAHTSHPLPWVVADLADPFVTGDAGLASVAEAAEAAWGPGIAYLAGVGWAGSQDPVLPPSATGRMLDAARVRLWWSAEGTLDAVRVLESIEHGCLPLQVMPSRRADDLRARLPRPLAPLVIGLDGLGAIDPFAAGDLLDAAASLVLRGSAERDMAVDALALGIIGHG